MDKNEDTRLSALESQLHHPVTLRKFYNIIYLLCKTGSTVITFISLASWEDELKNITHCESKLGRDHDVLTVTISAIC